MYAPSSRTKKGGRCRNVAVSGDWTVLKSSEVHKLGMNKAIYKGCPIASCVLLDRLGNKQSD